MTSFIAWIDHDAEARARSTRLIALFDQKESRDELGIGAIRDSFADILFPGTSTIQTRLRYMLIVPWVYKFLEDQIIPSGKFEKKARDLELSLVTPLLNSHDTSGVFGKNAGEQLKRLPSSVYWSGLIEWGILRSNLSQNDYHRNLDAVYQKRKLHSLGKPDFEELLDDFSTWHTGLPGTPDDFPESLIINLTAAEAQFIKECIAKNADKTLLAHLMVNEMKSDQKFIWDHESYNTFSEDNKKVLYHARLFSFAMHGAALLYNLMLAELQGTEELVEDHEESLKEWNLSSVTSELRNWNLSDMWGLFHKRKHNITIFTRDFVTAWVDFLKNKLSGQNLKTSKIARNLIISRERQKDNKSRFDNRQLLDRWRGYSGLNPLSYRWPVVRQFLNDLIQTIG